MQIHGFQKTTLLDYPGHVAATLFTGNCNFRCPFCHNAELVLHPGDVPCVSEDEIFAFLKKRKGILEGVAITGGEPTLQPDLIPFLQKLKDLEYLVKLDTNGYRPDALKEVLDLNLADYVAMDIKSSRLNYGKVAGKEDLNLDLILRSVDLLMNSHIEFEFRTTVVKELHSREDFEDIALWIAGAPAYYLQNYNDSDRVMFPGFSSCSKEELEEFRQILLPTVPNTSLRGID